MIPAPGLLDAAALRAAVIARMAVGWAIVGVLVVIGAAFGVAALWQILAHHYGVLAATWSMSACFFLVAIFFAIILSLRSSVRRRRRMEMRAAAARVQYTQLAPLLVTAFTSALAAGRALRR